MKNLIKLTAKEISSFLTDKDDKNIKMAEVEYYNAIEIFRKIETNGISEKYVDELKKIYDKMGKELLRSIIKKEDRIHVYPFSEPWQNRGEVSRLIAKLRDKDTGSPEFIYYTQRAYEILFKFAYHEGINKEKHYFLIKTPVDKPCQNYAIHKIPNMDESLKNTVMCVMLRGALLPSMIMAKEIQEFTYKKHNPDFALFRIKRNEKKKEDDMEYILNLDKSFFELNKLDGRDLIFADPMNATGGSLLTVINFLKDNGVKPRSIKFFNIISSLKGALQCIRHNEKLEIFTLWLDPVLNEYAYILPGLGDAGDRLNGKDEEEDGRNIIQLISSYESSITKLYRHQIRKIEEIVLGKID